MPRVPGQPRGSSQGSDGGSQIPPSSAVQGDLLERLDIGVYRTTLDGRILAGSPAFLRLLGAADIEDVQSVPLSRFLAQQVVSDHLGEAEQDRASSRTCECELRHSDGSSAWVTLIETPGVTDSGEAILEGLIADISARKRGQEASRESARKLHQAQKMEAIGRLSARVAHDLNNLLFVILGNSGLLRARLKGEDRSVADEITQATERATSVTRQLLSVGGKQSRHPQRIEFDDVVRGADGALRHEIGGGIGLKMDLRAGSATIYADPRQIEQVLLCLVGNSREAMPHGGTISIDTRKVGASARVTVTDGGEGMDPATRSRIFEPFFTTKATGPGAGLGLSMVYGIVKQSGGDVTVESKVGEGTVFEIDFPLDREAPPSIEREECEVLVDPGAPTETLLVAEDDERVRLLTTRVLRRHGYGVLEAADGDEAVEVFRRHSAEIDLLLTDVAMPGMGGIELAERVLRLNPNMRVLLMSAYSEEVDARSQFRWPYLQKPYAIDQLLQKVRSVLGARPVPPPYEQTDERSAD